MPLNGSGPISIGGSTAGQSINLEFGRTATQQTSMSQLYRGGGIVGSGAPNVPTSGTISLSQFYGAANRISQTITISANQTNYVFNTAKVTGYQAGLMDITLVINSGIFVSSNTTGGAGLLVDTSWSPGDTLAIVNSGFIVGMGGSGGNGAYRISKTGYPATAGGGGGLALQAQRAVSVNNAGTIAGGGGGGGAGDIRSVVSPGEPPTSTTVYGGGGGGGRTGSTNSPGGAGGYNSPATEQAGRPGNPGTLSAAGTGGSGSFPGTGGYSGATGGGWGAAGSSGAGPDSSGGGSGGAAISGNSNITWVATGTRIGAIT